MATLNGVSTSIATPAIYNWDFVNSVRPTANSLLMLWVRMAAQTLPPVLK